jgi:hypothetical protein
LGDAEGWRGRGGVDGGCVGDVEGDHFGNCGDLVVWVGLRRLGGLVVFIVSL